ncbi:peptidase [Spirochaetia bacterium]|nr:peptidase [Spirochaetia bacterium]
MLVSVIPIGNSKGIRLPKNIINELNIDNKVELEVHNKEIILRRVAKKPREGWAEACAAMHERGEDEPLIPDTLEDTSFEWEW